MTPPTDCNCSPYAPVTPTTPCEGNPWLGWEVQKHVSGSTYIGTYLDEGATASRILSAGTDLFISITVSVNDAGSATPFELEIASHTASTGAGKIVLDKISIDLDDLASGTHWFTVSALIPSGTFYSMRVNNDALLQSFAYYQTGAIA